MIGRPRLAGGVPRQALSNALGREGPFFLGVSMASGESSAYDAGAR
jgi:hypothetical protein